MTCRDCNRPLIGGPWWFGRANGRSDSASAVLEKFVCPRCGAALLPVSAPGEPLLDKLSQLARFGLTAGGSLSGRGAEDP